MSSDGAFARGIRWEAAGRLSAQLVSWVATVAVLRLLTPEDYGLVAVCTAVLGAVSILSEFAISAGVVQAKTLDREQLRSVFGAALLISGSCALLVTLTAPMLAAFFRAPGATVLIQVSTLQLVLAPFAALSDATLNRELRFRAMAAVDFLGMLVASLGTVALAWSGAGVWSLVLGPIAGTAARVALLQGFAPMRLWPSFRLGPARALIRFGATVAASRMAGYVFGQSDLWIAGRMLSKVQLGEYSVAMQLAMLPLSKTMGILNSVLFPILARMNRADEDVRASLLQGLRTMLYVGVPMLWSIVVVADPLIPLLLGQKWIGAVPVLALIGLVLPVRIVSVLLSSVLLGSGRADLDLRNTLTGALLLPPLFLVGVQFGAAGLAAAWIVGLPLTVALNLARSRAALRLTFAALLRAAAPPFACGLVLLGVGLGTKFALSGTLASWAAMAIALVAGWLVFVAVVYLTDRPALLQLAAVAGMKPRQ